MVFVSCSTKKNTIVSRAYHNLTARYNGYYYSGLSIEEGLYNIEKANKDNFDKVLPIYIYPSTEKAKNTFPDFDKAIKKINNINNDNLNAANLIPKSNNKEKINSI